MSNVTVSREFLENNPFYIIDNGVMFQLRLKKNHFVMCNANNEDEILERTRVILERYNTPWRLEEALHDVEIQVSKSEKVRRELEYKKKGKTYDTELLSLIGEMSTFEKKVLKKKTKKIGKIKIKIK